MRKHILDLDTGIDDTPAIAYALGSPEAELIGITATYGNVMMSQGIRNDLAITDLFNHAEVFVHAGLAHASNKETFEVLKGSQLIHDKNGISDAILPDSPRCQEASSAVDFIINSAHKLQQGSDLCGYGTTDQYRRSPKTGPF